MSWIQYVAWPASIAVIVIAALICFHAPLVRLIDRVSEGNIDGTAKRVAFRTRASMEEYASDAEAVRDQEPPPTPDPDRTEASLVQDELFEVTLFELIPLCERELALRAVELGEHERAIDKFIEVMRRGLDGSEGTLVDALERFLVVYRDDTIDFAARTSGLGEAMRVAAFLRARGLVEPIPSRPDSGD